MRLWDVYEVVADPSGLLVLSAARLAAAAMGHFSWTQPPPPPLQPQQQQQVEEERAQLQASRQQGMQPGR
jgi:hypothetical protein